MNRAFSAHGWKAALVGLAGGPEFLVTSGRVLDGYWKSYFATGDPEFVRSILAYEESEDLLLRTVNENAQVLVTDQRPLSLLDRLRVVPTDAGFVTDFELDTLAGILFRSPGFRDDLIPGLKPSSRFLFGFFQRPAASIEGQR